MSAISQISISRPVLAGVMSVLLILFGIVGYTFLGTREYPVTDSPIVMVTTVYPGASADIIASQVTKPLEEAIAEANGIRALSSVSREQVSIISVEFNLDADLEAAANDVRDKVSKSRQQLPTDIEPTIVEKAGPNDFLVFLTVQSDTKSLEDITDYVTINIKEKLQSIPGVRLVDTYAGKKRAMRLRMDPVKMASYGLTPSDVQDALRRENVDLPSGRIEGENTEVSLRTQGRLVTEDEFNDMIILEKDGAIVRFKDLGTAVMSSQNERTAMIVGEGNTARYGVGTGVAPQRGANSLAIVKEFEKRFKEIVDNAPKDYIVSLGKDFTVPVKNSLSEVEETLFLAFGLVAIIIFIFLRDWRSTLIPLVAIPVSIISAFFIMYIADFSINVLTLLGLVLAIGLVVDDAIVVLENIYTKIEQGMSPIEAARKGSDEIYFAVVSTTVTLAAVFLPILFLGGITGRLFKEFAIVVAGSVLISAFVALTLSPMMSAYLLKKDASQGWLYRKTEPWFIALNNGYERALRWFFRMRWVGFALLLGSFGIAYLLLPKLPSELAPLEDRSLVGLVVLAPEGTSFENMEATMKEINNFVTDSIPDLNGNRTYASVAAGPGTLALPVNTGFQWIFLKDPKDRKSGMTQQQVYEKMVRASQKFRDVMIIPIQIPTIGGFSSSQPLQYIIQAPDLPSLIDVMPKLMGEVYQSPKLFFPDPDFKINRPEIGISIDRQRAAQAGISTQEIGTTLQLALSGRRYGYFIYNDRQYEVIGQLDRRERSAPADLRSLFLRADNGEMISLDNLVKMEETVSPPAIYRYNQSYSATISATPAQGVSLGEAIKEMDNIAMKVLPENFSTDLGGQSRDYSESSSSLIFAFIFAIILIYLVLAAQFESLIDPFIILLTVPMAITGALLSLWMTGQSINVFSEIGIIMLIGLITKNGILIVEFANQRKEEGMSVKDAVLSAAISRFRPILMTTLAMIFGTLPIALSLGTSSGSRTSLGIVVVGGLVFAGVLTLFVIPAVYSYFSRSYVHKVDDDRLPVTNKRAIVASIVVLILFVTPAYSQPKQLSLKEAVELAQKNNPELKASTLEVSRSRQQMVISRALVLPSVNVVAQANHYFQLTPFFGFGTTPSSDSKIPYGRFGGQDQFVAGISALQPIYNPQAQPSMQRARLSEREAILSLTSKQLLILSEIKQNYLRQLVLSERIKLQRESINRNHRVLKDAKVLYIQGKGLRVDTLRAYTSLKSLEPELLRLSYAYETGYIQLKTLIGLDSLQEIELTDSLYVPDAEIIPGEEEVFLSAKQNNPDVLSVAIQQEIADQQVRQANASRLPVLSAVGLYQLQTQTSSFDYKNAYYPSSSYVGLQLSVPLFAGLSNQAKSKQASIAREQAELRTKYNHEQLRSLVHQTVANGREAIVRMQSTAIVNETARLTYDIIQYRYQKGIASRLELNDAELALTASQSNYLEAVFDYLSARIALERIMGKVI
ncbi:MAG: efflux RND transporter permease subunit [Bacteroidota bacterium]